MLKVEGLVKKFDRRLAIEGISFEIEAGDCLGVLGAEGSGKSVILRMIVGALEADAGEIRVLAVDIGGNRKGAQNRLAYVPEICPAWPQMRTPAFLGFLARLAGHGTQKARFIVTEAARAADLGDAIRTSVDALDRGASRRLALAAALIREPAVLVWDEPLSGLDALQAEQIREVLRRAAVHRTLVVAARDPHGIADLCSHALVIDKGRPLFVGRVDALRERAHKADVAEAVRSMIAAAKVAA